MSYNNSNSNSVNNIDKILDQSYNHLSDQEPRSILRVIRDSSIFSGFNFYKAKIFYQDEWYTNNIIYFVNYVRIPLTNDNFNFLGFTLCTNTLSTSLANNKFGNFFKSYLLYPSPNFISNIFGISYVRNFINICDRNISVDIGTNLLLYSALKYTEEDSNILFRKYSVFTSLNPLNYHFKFKTGIFICTNIDPLTFTFSLFDFEDHSIFCYKFLLKSFRKYIIGISENNMNNHNINIINYHYSFSCSVDLVKALFYLSKHTDKFDFIGDW